MKEWSVKNWRRNTIGIAAVVALLIGIFLALTGWQDAGYVQSENIALRLSLVFALWWLAYPEFAKLPRWTWLVLLSIFLMFIFARRLVVVVPLLFRLAIEMAPLLAVLWVLWRLKPRPKK